MSHFARDFFRKMQDAFDGIVATSRTGRKLDLEDALGTCRDMMLDCSARSGTFFMAGNGGSASIASHITVDLWKNAGIRSMAFNDSSLLTCLGNDLGYEQVFAAPLLKFARRGDAVALISSSGKSPNMLAAARAARKRGCRLITLTGFKPGNALRALGDVNFYVPSGEYGFVETVHAAISHALVDNIMARRR